MKIRMVLSAKTISIFGLPWKFNGLLTQSFGRIFVQLRKWAAEIEMDANQNCYLKIP